MAISDEQLRKWRKEALYGGSHHAMAALLDEVDRLRESESKRTGVIDDALCSKVEAEMQRRISAEVACAEYLAKLNDYGDLTPWVDGTDDPIGQQLLAALKDCVESIQGLLPLVHRPRNPLAVRVAEKALEESKHWLPEDVFKPTPKED